MPLLRRRILELIESCATPAPPGGRVLDIGCGEQPFRPHLESIGYTYTGLDVTQNSQSSVDIVCAIDEDLSSLSIRGPFQLILCTEVLEHVADWQRAFHNMASLLSERGRLLVTCPHFYPLHEEPYDFWRPTLHAIDHFGSAEGLRPLRRAAAGDVWDVVGTLLGSCWPTPVTESWGDWALTRLVSLTRRGLAAVLTRRWLQASVRWESQLYLSNVALLERPPSLPSSALPGTSSTGGE